MAKEFQIGNILKRIKRPVSLIDDHEYKLVTIKMNHKGVVLRETKLGALIKSGMYRVKSGDFILSGIDARNGAFGIVPKELDGAIVTNDFWYFEINEEIISKELFLELTATTWFDEICKRGSDGTTQRVRLQSGKFFNQSILLPEIGEQVELLSKIHQIKVKQAALTCEIESQKSLLAQLKQSILQEAIHGKLTAEWRAQRQADGIETEPASELLKRIQAEKARLINPSTPLRAGEKKIKKDPSTSLRAGKSLPTITEEEKPFELPEGWEWCRLGEICNNITSGSTPSKESFFSDEIPYLKVYNIRNQKVDFHYKPQFIKRKIHESSLNRCILRPGDVIMNIVGPPLGKVAIIPESYPEWNCNQAISIFKCFDKEVNKYIFKYLSSGVYLRYMNYKGMAGQDNISVTQCKNIILPLPSLEEQKAIVEKVESLMEKCSTLEEEISQSEQHAQMLMQAVLKESFEN